jgi:hypothetical protein
MVHPFCAISKYVVCERVRRRNYPGRASIGFSGAGNHRFRRRQSQRTFPRILRRHHPQQRHARSLCPGSRSILPLVRRIRSEARRNPAAARLRLYRIQADDRAVHQAAPGRAARPVQLACHQAGRSR